MRPIWLLLAVLAISCGKSDSESKLAVPPAAPTPTTPEGVDSATKTFWAWFAEHAAALRAEPDLRTTMEKISAELAKVNPGVFAEIGIDGEGRKLVLSADGKTDLFPTVERIFAVHPTVPGWTIFAFRQRDAGFAIEMGGTKLELAAIKYVATRSGDKLDLHVFMPELADPKQMNKLSFIMLDHAIGEHDMETKIGGVDFAPLAKAPAVAKPLTALAADVDSI